MGDLAKHPIRIQDFMRGSLIEYQEERPFTVGNGKWFITEVWGTTTDDNERDVLEIGKFGSSGYIDISCVRGIDITEDLLINYGFINIKTLSNCITFYRDDIGYIKLSTYGIEHIYMGGRPIIHLHNFQRVFLDYTGKMLNQKESKNPIEEKKFSFQIIKNKTGEEILEEIKDIESRFIDTKSIPEVDLEL